MSENYGRIIADTHAGSKHAPVVGDGAAQRGVNLAQRSPGAIAVLSVVFSTSSSSVSNGTIMIFT